METLSNPDPASFVAAVQPLLASNDLQGLLAFLKANYTAAQIVSLLISKHEDARKVAALALSLVGGKCCIEDLGQSLKDPDPMINQMAEHALWSIWFRCGSTDDANRELCRGSQAMSRRDFEAAIAHFNRAISIDPTFAEAYNQRAIAHYLTECYEPSLRDCQRAVRRMPCHFGAWAGMGHCQAHLGQTKDAIESYEHALHLNPHLQNLKQAIQELKNRADD